MREFLQFALLGIGSAAVYALAAQGIVAIHLGSGVLNFAHGAMALLGAEVYVLLAGDHDVAPPLAFAAGLVLLAAVGAVIYLLVMRPLQEASSVVRVVSTLGVLAAIQQFVILVFGTDLKFADSFLPQGRLTVSEVSVDKGRATLLVIAALMTVVLHLLYSRTRFGFVTRAAAENRRAASALGYSPVRIGVANWSIGGALAAAAGMLTVPISGLNVEALTLLVLPALAVSLVGGFRSFPVTLLAALAIGTGQALVTRYVTEPGWSDALPFLAIVVVLSLRGAAIPGRAVAAQHLPRVGVGHASVTKLLAFGAGLLVLIWGLSDKWTGPLVSTMVWATIALSVVVLMGFAGQVSLGQFALAGFGALVAGRCSGTWQWPFPLAVAAGVAATTVLGLVFALPSLRTRGVTLAVITLGLALSIQKVVFGNIRYVGDESGTPVGNVRLFGWDVDPFEHPRRFASILAVVLAFLAGLAMNARSGATGRRMLAVRTNERAAAALGIRVRGVKFFAFGLSSAFAAVGGIFLGFRGSTVRYSEFDVFSSLNAVVFTLIGGVGYVHGAVLAATLAPGTLVSRWISGIGNLEHYMVLFGGVLLVVTLILNPDGLAHGNAHAGERLRQRRKRHRAGAAPPAPGADRALRRVDAKTLTATEIIVRYGLTTAVDRVSLTLRPGQITGLIGANGAGKTSFIDALSGFTPVAGGRFVLDGEDIGSWAADERARRGISRTFQSLELFEDMTVRDNLLIGTEDVPWWRWLTGLVRSSSTPITPDAQTLIERLDLADHLDKRPGELPFGQRRLLGVARAAAARPSVLLVDEPAAGLNETETAQLGTVLRWLAEDWGMAILLVEHDVGLVVSVSDEIVAVDFGQPIFTGEASTVLHDAAVQSAYLGTTVVRA